MVVLVLRPDLQTNAGDLQLCAGQKSGCEAGIHAMHQIFEDDETHGVIQSLPSPCLANIARLCETRSEITNFLLLWDRVDRRSPSIISQKARKYEIHIRPQQRI